MKRKIIGITPRLLTEGDTVKQFANDFYLSALTKRDFNVIMLTLDNPQLDEILALCDGFLITGGSDVDPVFFNETNEGLSKGIKPQLDLIDKQVVTYAARHCLPILGICRGHQTINVFLGGSLFQDIGDDHRSLADGHEVHTIKNRLLNFPKNIITNSYHHQAIKALAPNMTAIAWHKDGTIEAFVHDVLPIIGIQWHPERLQGTAPSEIIFDKFAELVNKR
ncbi:MAG TPA: type 1 glutamine amidotransferase [Bacilli bacterium]|nr:type 1 glutamine amidotransferase [Bacilli bacterium]